MGILDAPSQTKGTSDARYPKKTDLPINVKDYGAKGDGTTDDAVAIQAALNVSTGSGAKEIYVPAGSYIIGQRLSVPANVHFRGAGMAATTITTTGSAAGILSIDGLADINISNMTFSQGTATNSIGIISNGSATITQQRITIDRCRVINTVNNAVRFSNAVQNLSITNCVFDSCAVGISIYQPAVGYATAQILIANNKWTNVGSNNCQIFGGNDPAQIRIFNVKIIGNDMRNFQQVGPAGPIPMEPTGINGLVIADNIIASGATRGVSLGNDINVSATGNTIDGQSYYAFELNGGSNYTISGNTVSNCASFAIETGSGFNGTARLTNININGNTYTSSGLSTSQTTDMIKIAMGRRIRISGNSFTDWQYLRAGIRIGDGTGSVAEDVVIENNTFAVVDVNTPIASVINVRTALRTNVSFNKIRILRDLASSDNLYTIISTFPDSNSNFATIENNDIVFSGQISAAPGTAGIGLVNSAAGPFTGLTIRRNRIINAPIGVSTVVNSADLRIENNDTVTCASPDVIAATALRRTKLELEATTFPGSGTWDRGAIIWNSAPTSSGSIGWICTTAGSPGTWTPMYNNSGLAVDPDMLSVGEGTQSRRITQFNTAAYAHTPGSGSIRGQQFTATKTETITKVRLYTIAAAAATPTLCKVGVYQVDANNNHTLIAQTANDTTLFSAAGTVYTPTFTSSFSKITGTRYCVVVLVISGATMPSFTGFQPALEMYATPSLGTRFDSQTDLPSTMPSSSLAQNVGGLYAVLLP